MPPYNLTKKQQQLIAEAKASGKRRVTLPLTTDQQQVEQKHLDEMESQVRAELGHPLPSDLAIRLRVARTAAGMSLAEVGEKANMTRQAVLAIETGKNDNPKINTLRRIAKAVGMDLQIDLVASC